MGKKKRDVAERVPLVDPFEVEFPGVREVEGPVPPEHATTPTGAASLARLAGALGFEVVVFRPPIVDDSLVVEGIDRERGVAFRAIWEKSRAKGATIYERGETEWAEVPALAEKVSGRGKDRGVHPTGYVDGVRLVPTRSPLGVSVGVTELSTRLRALE